uniref:tumor necrosis factor receptor superfamily member 14 isoform X1 n=1 Tax=Maylandia zebra TaxID=106582 RepID=UPI000D3203F7|nr:tumor necrosis factor receptor superfamily member 14 isoform X1 [Maylandia zebra]XP_024654603.1 tumor necrosis factor receptor superfamily member 14 isoform X1 [Maylandia zebra]XP_024654604.1 tumor necrosis factor receptor superfamily member 14 isoform X1 [Maylandia zebra]XP_024654605.1 tumor necrosis factor receptor superfamily member 14 isoform X1 [Maylandia zebra]XP_024654606.1 tumor necrosis factor receptor superfamily member 14 isoform X1 [Maylandia zebra]
MSSRRKPVNATAFLIIVMTVFSGLSLTCHPAEYQIGNECCPKCPPGSRVKTHCKEYSSTSCAPCMGGTYTDQQNGLERCLSCTNCDSGSGLRVKTPCTSTSDTVCEPLERFYCVSYEKDSCGRAQEHRHCKPGQYIRQNGTASTDTECSDCSSGTFSNGTFHSCQPHTQCHSLNLQLITEGTLAADNQCGEKSNHVTPTITVIVLIIVGLVLVLLVLLVLLCLKKKGIVFKSRNRKNSTLSSPKGEQAELHMQSQRGKPSEDKEKENGLLPPE